MDLNPQIRRLFLVFAFLFVALIATATYWLWRSRPRGTAGEPAADRPRPRGGARADRWPPTAGRSWRRTGDAGWRTGNLVLRRYPERSLTAHAVGYSTIGRSRTGLELSLNDYPTGSNANLSTVLDSTLDKLRGIPRQGNDVVTTLDLDAQRAAADGPAGKCGAVVALEPSTGRVLALASSPSFNPNLVEGDFDSIEAITAPACRSAPRPGHGRVASYPAPPSRS